MSHKNSSYESSVVMQELREFVSRHAERGTCRCGRCIDHPGEDKQPEGHTVDMVFFEVSLKDVEDPAAAKEQLRSLVLANKAGEFCDLDLPSSAEHSYLQVGAWIGDQGMALTLMGLGHLLGLWQVMTPKMLGLPEDLVQLMVGQGMISIMPPALPETVAGITAAVDKAYSKHREQHD